MKKLVLLQFLFCFSFSSLVAQNWLRVGEGLHLDFRDEYNEMIEFNGEIYTVGYFFNGTTGSSDAYTPIVQRLVGNDWETVGTGFTGSASAAYSIYAIAEYNSELYIAGDFIMDNGVDPTFGDIAKWDDTNSRWIPVGVGTTSAGAEVYELIVFDGELYAGGKFTALGAGGTNNIASWNGIAWSAVGTGTSVASGSQSEFGDQVRSMVIYDNELIVGGKFTTAGGTLVQNIASWDGTSWDYLKGSAVEGGGGVGGFNSGQVDIQVMSVFDGDLYIGGAFSAYYNLSFIGSSTSVPNNLVVWNGTSFAAPSQATPSNSVLNGMTIFDGRIYIGNVNSSNIYSWDGSIFEWRLEPDRDPLRQRPISLYSNATDLYYTDKYGIWKFNDPLPAFATSNVFPCPGDLVTFTDQSEGTSEITAWNWTFPGGTPSSSTQQNPEVTYASLGDYDVTLEVTSAEGTSTLIKKNAIRLSDEASVTQDPEDAEVCAGEVATFTAGVSFSTNGLRQWQVDDGSGFVDLENGGENNVTGATGAPLSFTPTNENDGYKFRLKLIACSNEVFSEPATLTVNELAVIEEQPEARALCESGDVSFSIAASASGTIDYQWQYQPPVGSLVDLTDGSVITGSNTSTLALTGADNTLAELQDSDNSDGITFATFRCTLSVNGCEVNSSYVRLTIYDAPIPASPIEVTTCDGGNGVNTSFSTSVDPSISGLEYQWQVDEGTGFVDISDSEIYSGSNTETLSLTGATSALSGNEYRCEVGACTTPVVTDAATLTIDDAPVIVQQPVTANICVGGDASFSVEATGESLNYQWQMRPTAGNDFTDLLNNDTYFGTDSPTLQVSGASMNMNSDRFRCVISSGSCTINSGAPTLRVFAAPTISGSPADRTVCEGAELVSFGKSASNFISSAHSYQWQEAFAGSDIFVDITDDTKFSGITGPTLSILEPTISMNGNRYRQTVIGCVDEIASDPATLTVNQLPLITSSPTSQTVCVGERVTFTAAAIGTDVMYQWWRDTGDGNFSPITAFSESTDYLITAAASNFNGYKYKCVVRAAGPCEETVETAEATLVVNETTITEEPISSVTLCAGENTTFSVVASGESITYQWYSLGNPIADDEIFSGTTTASLTITGAVSSMNSISYYCVASGTCGDATSTQSTLFVNFAVKPDILPNISDPENVTLTANGSNGESYEWFLNDEPHTSGTVSTISIDEEGSYTVIAMVSGCASEVSDPYVYEKPEEPLGLGDGVGVSIYPNPIERFLQTDYPEELEVRVFGLDGRMILKGTIPKKGSLDLESLKSGQYMIQLRSEERLIYSGKVIKTN